MRSVGEMAPPPVVGAPVEYDAAMLAADWRCPTSPPEVSVEPVADVFAFATALAWEYDAFTEPESW